MDRRAIDAAPIPTVILRDGRVVYANRAALELVGLPAESFLGRPQTDFIAAGHVERVVRRQTRRLRGERVPAVYEATLLDGAGRPVAVQVHAAVEEADVVVQLLDARLQHDERRRLTELARLGARVQAERTEAGVLAAVRAGLAELGLGSALLEPEGERLRVRYADLGESQALLERALGAPLEGVVRPWTAWARALWEEGTAFTDDWPGEIGPFLGAPAPEALAAAGGPTRGAGVRIDLAGSRGAMLLAAGDWLDASDLPVLRLFGSQVQAALSAARIIRDLEARNAELAALNRLAETAAAEPDLPAFFRRASEEVMRAAGADGIALWLLDDERRELEMAHDVGATPAARRGFARIPVDGTFFGRVLLTQQPVVFRADEYPEPGRAIIAGLGFETHLSVPLRVRSRAVGILNVGFRGRRDAEGAHLALVVAMAGPFAAAVEAQRLLADLRRRVADLEAVNALGLTLFAAPPGQTGAVLEAATAELGRALGATAVVTLLHDEEEGVLRSAAAWGAPVPPRPVRIPLRGPSLAAEALRTRRAVHCDDSSADPRSGMRGVPGVPALSLLLVPLIARGAARGVVAVGRERGRRFGSAEVALASALAGAAAVGLENAALHAETARRAEELGLLLEVGRSLVATLELEEVLGAGVRNLARIVAAPDAYLFLAEESGRLVARAAAGGHPEVLGRAVPLDPREASLPALVHARREPVVVEDFEDHALRDSELRRATGARAALGLPLLVRGRAIGAAVVVDPAGPRRFAPADVERARAIANQLAVAAENARLYESLRRSYAELERAQAQLIQKERLAALGEISAVVAHEVRNPLGVIFNSLGSLRRLLRPEGDTKMLLDIVQEEAERLNRIVGDLLDFARPSTPALRPEPLARLVDDAVSAALGENAPGIALEWEMDLDLPPVPVDARLLRQAILNVAVNAVQAMPRGGRLSVRARRDGSAVRLEISDTGPGIPEEVRHRIFEPFFTTKPSGTGLGLAVVRRIVDGHGGEVAAASEPGRGTTFSIRLPLGRGAEPAPAAPVEKPRRFG